MGSNKTLRQHKHWKQQPKTDQFNMGHNHKVELQKQEDNVYHNGTIANKQGLKVLATLIKISFLSQD